MQKARSLVFCIAVKFGRLSLTGICDLVLSSSATVSVPTVGRQSQPRPAKPSANSWEQGVACPGLIPS